MMAVELELVPTLLLYSGRLDHYLVLHFGLGLSKLLALFPLTYLVAGPQLFHDPKSFTVRRANFAPDLPESANVHRDQG
jgi:hypothetical protein